MSKPTELVRVRQSLILRYRPRADARWAIAQRIRQMSNSSG
jgi:hypothetical protein